MLTITCAWCGKSLGEKEGGDGVSHSICEECAARLKCQVCHERIALAGVYCQPCLDQETEGMSDDDLRAASDLLDSLGGS